MQVFEVYDARIVCDAGNCHHATSIGPLQYRQKPPSQGEVTQVVSPELQLEPVLGPGLRGYHDSRVVDQNVEAPLGRETVSELLNAGEVRKVQDRDRDL